MSRKTGSVRRERTAHRRDNPKFGRALVFNMRNDRRETLTRTDATLAARWGVVIRCTSTPDNSVVVTPGTKKKKLLGNTPPLRSRAHEALARVYKTREPSESGVDAPIHRTIHVERPDGFHRVPSASHGRGLHADSLGFHRSPFFAATKVLPSHEEKKKEKKSTPTLTQAKATWRESSVSRKASCVGGERVWPQQAVERESDRARVVLRAIIQTRPVRSCRMAAGAPLHLQNSNVLFEKKREKKTSFLFLSCAHLASETARVHGAWRRGR